VNLAWANQLLHRAAANAQRCCGLRECECQLRRPTVPSRHELPPDQ